MIARDAGYSFEGCQRRYEVRLFAGRGPALFFDGFSDFLFENCPPAVGVATTYEQALEVALKKKGVDLKQFEPSMVLEVQVSAELERGAAVVKTSARKFTYIDGPILVDFFRMQGMR